MPSTLSDYNEETALNQSMLNDLITWPITPKRKGKRQSEKPPFVLTSSVRKEAEKKTIALKKESEMQKEKRKAERLKKKQIKEHSNKKGKQIKGKETLIKRSKDAIISGFNKTLLATETKMPNILENIQETNEEVRVAKDNYQLKTKDDVHQGVLKNIINEYTYSENLTNNKFEHKQNLKSLNTTKMF
jgi:hypothetical protein